MDEGSIIRVEHDTENPYVMITKSMAQHRGLSFDARGVLLYLLSKPNDWKLQPKDIQVEGSIGRDQCMRILKELEGAGYLIVDREIGKPNQYTVKERPNGFSVTGNQSRESRLLIKNEEVSKETNSRAATRDRSYMGLDINRPAPAVIADDSAAILASNLVKLVAGKTLISKNLQKDLASKSKVQVGNTTVVYDSVIDMYDADPMFKEFVIERVRSFKSLLHPSRSQDMLKNICNVGKPPVNELGVKQWPGFHYWKQQRYVGEGLSNVPVIEYGVPTDEVPDDID